MFYVIWRAWSHWNAYRGAEYLEKLLKLGMIVEKPSKEMNSVYSSKGIEGDENSAPDQTTSDGVKLQDASTGSVKDLAKEGADVASLSPKNGGGKGIDGGKGPAPDGTSTPKDMIFDTTQGGETPKSKPSYPDGSHPSLLIRPTQIPLLAKTFNLRPNEVIDVTRALEQAELRARKIESGGDGTKSGPGGGEDVKDSKAALEDAGKGTEWRGNLHR
jgi:hypothetical protein